MIKKILDQIKVEKEGCLEAFNEYSDEDKRILKVGLYAIANVFIVIVLLAWYFSQI